jgi:hypothetical protein
MEGCAVIGAVFLLLILAGSCWFCVSSLRKMVRSYRDYRFQARRLRQIRAEQQQKNS